MSDKVGPAEASDEFRYFTPSGKAGVLFVRSLSDEAVLEAARDSQSSGYRRVVAYMERDTNPSWITSQCAQAAYERGLLDEVEFDRILGD
jgi:hypothetical protein